MIQKKAQGLPLTVIVIAVLALAVMIILIIMLVTKTSVIGKSGTCENQGGLCKLESELEKDNWGRTVCPEGLTKWSVKKCEKVNAEEQVCCFPTGG